jgi:radical SAM superfamily enzyme YgiQ (UPF0313 family)
MTTNRNSQSGAGMKFLLVRPPVTLKIARRLKSFLHLEPLALEIVAGGIPSRHQTRILDLACEKSPEKAFKRALGEFQPDVLGFTAYSNEAATVKRLGGMAKAHRPGVVVMVGGVHATLAPEDLRLPGVFDLVVRGEGGTAMRTLVPLLEAKAPWPESDAFLPTNSPRFDELAATLPPQLPPYDAVPRALLLHLARPARGKVADVVSPGGGRAHQRGVPVSLFLLCGPSPRPRPVCAADSGRRRQ